MKRLLLSLCVALMATASVVAPAVVGQADDAEQFTAVIDGRKTWTVGYGFGSARGLAAAGVSGGQVSLDQSLAVDLTAEALSIIRVEGHFDDQSPDKEQSLAIYLDTESLDGVLGDFSITSMQPFTSYRRTMTGLQLEYSFADAVLTGVASRVEGSAESKTFVGSTAEASRVFSAYRDDEPWVEQPYARSIQGLFAFPVEEPIVEEFTDVALRIQPTGPMLSLLKQYGLGFLDAGAFQEAAVELTGNNYAVIERQTGDETETVLLLMGSITTQLRDAVKAAIDNYNNRTDAAYSYPLIQGSDYETELLGQLTTYAVIQVDETPLALVQAVRQTYYSLGFDDIVASSVQLAISLDGGDTYRPTTHPDLTEYSFVVYPEEGVVEARFPSSFFSDDMAQFRVTFTYALSTGTYSLGLSLIPESERVTLNETRLERDQDYIIDYEVGLVILLVDVEDDDIVTIDYERYSTGLGGSAEYARYFYGLKLDLPVSDLLSFSAYFLEVVDDAGSVEDPNSATTMPNRQTVAGVSGSYSDGAGFSANFAVGYNVDTYPFDANARPNAANAVTALATTEDGTIVLVGHAAGLSTQIDGEWRAYSTSDGLTSNAVRCLAISDRAIYIGTAAGLTVIERSGDFPLDRAQNWSRLYEDDGLPDPSIGALLVHGGSLWIGTGEGLAVVPLDSIDDIGAWAVYRSADSQPLPSVQALAADGGSVYVGTRAGLYRFDLSSGVLEAVDTLYGLSVNALLTSRGTLYAASDRGLRALRGGIGTGWLTTGVEVSCLAWYENDLYYGTPAGVVCASDGTVSHSDWPVTALAGDTDSLWIGTQADATYGLRLWERRANVDTAYDNETARISGKNPSVYLDLEPSDWSDGGIIATGSFDKHGEAYDLSGRIDIVQPAYRAIGSVSGRDVVAWDLYGAFDLIDDWTLTVSNAYDIAAPSAEDTTLESDTVATLRGSVGDGPDLTLSVSQRSENIDNTVRGSEILSFSYSAAVSETLFDDRLSLALSWSESSYEDHRYATNSVSNTLSVDTSLAPASSTQLSFKWTRPLNLRGSGWQGSETMTFGLDWSQKLGSTAVSLSGSLERKRTVPGGVYTASYDATATADFETLSWAEWEITPDLTVSVKGDAATSTVTGRTTFRLTDGVTTLRPALTLTIEDPTDYLRRQELKASLSVNTTAWELLTPSLTYTGTRKVSTYRSVDVITTSNHSLSLRMVWVPDTAERDTLTFGVRVRDDADTVRWTIDADNAYQLDITNRLLPTDADTQGDEASADGTSYPTFFLGVDTALAASFEEGETDVELTTTGRLSTALSSAWGGTLSTSAVLGSDASSGFYWAFVLKLTVYIEF